MARDDEAFQEFVVARWTALVRCGYLLTGDHGRAEDLVQTALERMHRRWAWVRCQDSPERYVRRIMVNLAISASRRRRFTERPLEAAPEPGCTDLSQQVVDRDLLWDALGGLPPRMRAVLVLRFYEDLPHGEIAALLGCSAGTVKSQTSRGLERLRARLDVSGPRPRPGPEPVAAQAGTTPVKEGSRR